MCLSITTLVENSKGEHLALKNEHGISFFIEYGGHKLLFDTGQSDTILQNAQELMIDLGSVEHIILSHGHYDHSGGYRYVEKVAPGAHLWMGKGFFEPKYGKRSNSYEYLGNNFSPEYLDEQHIAHTIVEEDVTEIVKDVYAVTNFPRVHANEVVNPRFVLKTREGFIPDRFDDEMLIAIDTPKGMVVILGCSHPGMRNMLDAVKSRFGKRIYAVLGGTHLVEAQGQCLQDSLAYLTSGEIEVVGVSHCTGKEIISHMGETNSNYFHNRTGSSLFVEV